MHVMRFGKLHYQRDRRAEHRNLAGEQEVVDERSPIHDDGGSEDIRHEGLHPREHVIREDFEPFGRLQQELNIDQAQAVTYGRYRRVTRRAYRRAGYAAAAGYGATAAGYGYGYGGPGYRIRAASG